MVRRALSALLASTVIAGCATTDLSFPNATPGKPLTVPAWEERPQGPGLFPAVVLLPGCHGVSESTHEWSRWCRDQGYVALVVDSWGPRGQDKTCAPNLPNVPDISNTERFDDAVGALRWLHSRPYVDRSRVGVIGWSNGGVFALALVNRSEEHTSELQSQSNLVCRLLLEKKKKYNNNLHAAVAERSRNA